jgi:hypothetical protein
MSRGFIRALWGTPKTDYDDGWIAPSARRTKMDKDISYTLKNPNIYPFRTYVFGKENFEYLKSRNISDCVLIEEKPFIYDLQKEFWRHKLDILKYAMEIDGYTELVYLDWDCIPVKKMDEQFWELLRQKREIQANLQIYRRRKCPWRDESGIRKVSNGGFLYIRDSKIPQLLISTWQNMEPAWKFWDEIAISKLIDNLTNGWTGVDKYFTEFEPDVCNLKKKSVFENKSSEKVYFIHFIQSNNNRKAKNEIVL